MDQIARSPARAEPRSGALRAVATVAAGAAVLSRLRGDRSTDTPGADRTGARRADERGRGRGAEAPQDLPARGWMDVLWRLYAQISEDRILSVAAGVTFYALLAIFPAIAALVSIYGLFADPATIQNHLALASGVLPDGALQVVGDQVRRISANGGSTLGWAFGIGLGVSLWSANAGMKAMFDALNVAYDEEEKRGFFMLTAQTLLFTLLAILFVILAIGGIVVVPVVLEWVGLGGVADPLVRYGRWPLLFAGVVFGLATLYRFGPSRARPQWRWVTWGSTVAAILWIAGSAAFSWYAANFGSYNETYGSLGAVIGFMTWIWLSSTVVLLGAELNSEMEHQTARDTTDGAPEPLGERGAHMADTVGEAR